MSAETAIPPEAAVTAAPETIFSAFQTRFPEAIGDTALLALLEAHRVVVDVAAPGRPWLLMALSYGLPLLAFILLWMSRQMTRSQAFLGYTLAQEREYSEATAAQIDQDIQRLLAECQTRVRCVLQHRRQELDHLALALLQNETIDAARVAQLLGPRPEPAELAEQQLGVPFA